MGTIYHTIRWEYIDQFNEGDVSYILFVFGEVHCALIVFWCYHWYIFSVRMYNNITDHTKCNWQRFFQTFIEDVAY